MVRYPFELWILEVTPGGKDENGFETQGSDEWVFHTKCYEQVMGKSQEYNKENGKSFYYSSIIFTQDNIDPVPTETSIQIRQNGVVRLSGTSKRFSNDHKHCRIWV